MKTSSKLAKFFDNALSNDARTALITSANGEYTVYGRYYIKPYNNEYVVRDIKSDRRIVLGTLKHAMSWCTLIDCNKYSEAMRLERLDLKLVSLQLDMVIHRKLIKSVNNHDKLVCVIKLQEDSYKKKEVLLAIEDIINKSKRLQERRFQKPKRNKFSYR